MSIYAIGDIQGCYDELQALLRIIDFKAGPDKLWFVGDLINRGPKSLETLRFVKSLDDDAITVLGNHDLHLLAVAKGYRQAHPSDTLNAILEAEDKDELLTWLSTRPLLHHDAELNITMVHAGIFPAWDLTMAQACAKEVENILQSEQQDTLLKAMYGNTPAQWDKNLQGIERWRFIINAFTRMRYVTTDGVLELTAKMAPSDAPEDLIPWFAYTPRAMAEEKIIFGHWASLMGQTHNPHAIALDMGCVWGNYLQMYNICTKLFFH